MYNRYRTAGYFGYFGGDRDRLLRIVFLDVIDK